MTVSINRGAPVHARSEGHIGAPADLVWTVLTDLARWPEWNPDISTMALDGPVSPGVRFRWKTGGMLIASQFAEVVPERRLVWTGRVLGISAIHVWELEPRQDGTWVGTEESFEGLLPKIFPVLMTRMLQQTLDKGIGMLRAESERRAVQAASSATMTSPRLAGE